MLKLAHSPGTVRRPSVGRPSARDGAHPRLANLNTERGRDWVRTSRDRHRGRLSACPEPQQMADLETRPPGPPNPTKIASPLVCVRDEDRAEHVRHHAEVQRRASVKSTDGEDRTKRLDASVGQDCDPGPRLDADALIASVDYRGEVVVRRGPTDDPELGDGAEEALARIVLWQMKNRAAWSGSTERALIGRIAADIDEYVANHWPGTASAPASSPSPWPACRTPTVAAATGYPA